MRVLLALAVACSGCEAIDDFSAFHVFASDGGDGGAVDLETPPDFNAPPDLAPPCVQTLANVGAGDFTIRFRIATTTSDLSTVLYQRVGCNAVTDFWDIDINALGTSGLVRVTVGQGNVGYGFLDTTIGVNDGNPHDVVTVRRAMILASTIDGTLSGSATAQWPLGGLPPLGVATGHPCEPPFGTLKPLVGTVTNVCITVP